MSKIRNQTTDVLKHLKERHSITSFEAFQKYGCTRLAAVIFRLRERGYNIETHMVEAHNRYDDTVQYARYVYKGRFRE